MERTKSVPLLEIISGLATPYPATTRLAHVCVHMYTYNLKNMITCSPEASFFSKLVSRK